MFKEAVFLLLGLHILIEALPLEPGVKSAPTADFDMMETAETKYKGGGGGYGGGGGGKVYVVKTSGGGGHHGGGGYRGGGGGGCCKGGGGGGKGFKKG